MSDRADAFRRKAEECGRAASRVTRRPTGGMQKRLCFKLQALTESEQTRWLINVSDLE
jgi:hypothetical protein